jgi:DNA-3-methyladenine glycosylase I
MYQTTMLNPHKTRCKWVNLKNSVYVLYHDTEWGFLKNNETDLFEFLVLESAQAGLSWETILKKRSAYGKVFLGFDPFLVSHMTDTDLSDAYTKDSGIVRNKLKIWSVRQNARAFLKVQEEYTSFSFYIRSFFTNHSFPLTSKDKEVQLEISKKLSLDLKKRGFSFVGPTILQSYLEAIGYYQNHEHKCFVSKSKALLP